MNRRRVRKKEDFEHTELLKKLKKYEERVEKFTKEKDLVIRRGHYNILVQETRRQLLKETYREMEIRNKFDLKLLERIDKDFKEHFINENDEKIDDAVL